MPTLTKTEELQEAMRLYERRYRIDEVANRLRIPTHKAKGYYRQYMSELNISSKGPSKNEQSK